MRLSPLVIALVILSIVGGLVSAKRSRSAKDPTREMDALINKLNNQGLEARRRIDAQVERDLKNNTPPSDPRLRELWRLADESDTKEATKPGQPIVQIKKPEPAKPVP